MGKLLFIFLAAGLFTSCTNNNDDHDGGPCEYKKMPFSATIISIKKEDFSGNDKEVDAVPEARYFVKLASNIPHYDTLQLEWILEHPITKNFLVEHHLIEGSVLKGTAELITSGSCEPASFQFDDSTLHSKEY